MYNNEAYLTKEPIAYQKVLNALEILKSISADELQTQDNLTELFDRVATEKERMTLTYKNKVFLAVVPIEDVKVIDELENCIDNANRFN